MKPLSGLHLDDHDFIDDEIHSVARYLDAVVEDGHEELTRDPMAAPTQLEREGAAIDALEEAKSKFVIDGKEGIENRLRDVLV